MKKKTKKKSIRSLMQKRMDAIDEQSGFGKKKKKTKKRGPKGATFE